MPNWKTHILAGLMIGGTLFAVFGDWRVLPVCLLYSLLPDLDHKMGTITWLFLGVSSLLIAVGVLSRNWAYIIPGSSLLLFSILAPIFFKHRGKGFFDWHTLHSFYFFMVSMIGLNILLNPPIEIILAGALGFKSHILLDKFWKGK